MLLKNGIFAVFFLVFYAMLPRMQFLIEVCQLLQMKRPDPDARISARISVDRLLEDIFQLLCVALEHWNKGLFVENPTPSESFLFFQINSKIDELHVCQCLRETAKALHIIEIHSLYPFSLNGSENGELIPGEHPGNCGT